MKYYTITVNGIKGYVIPVKTIGGKETVIEKAKDKHLFYQDDYNRAIVNEMSEFDFNRFNSIKAVHDLDA